MSEAQRRNSLSLEQPRGAAIGQLARAGAFWTFVSMAGKYLTTFVASALLSRLLLPIDFGLIGMVMTVTTLFQVFSDMGLGMASVQRRELAVADFDNLFWINVVSGLGISVCCALVSPWIAMFYRRQELLSISIVLGLGFVIGGISAQPMALMRRRMMLKQLLLFELMALILGALAAIAMAVAHCGVWALVVQSLLPQLVVAVCVLVHTKYRPGRPHISAATLQLLKFGGYMTLYGVVNYFARNLDNVLVGRVRGAEELGYYSRAYTLMMLPTYLATNSMMGVMVPALSAAAQDRQQLAHAYRRAVSCIAVLGIPLAIGLAAAAQEIVRLLYGPKWLPVVPLLFWLSIAGAGMPIHNTMGWLYVAVGKSKEMFGWGVVSSTLLCAGFSLGVHWGALGVSISYAALMVVCLTIPAVWLAHRAAQIDFLPTLQLVAAPLAASLAMGAAMWGIGWGLTQWGTGWGIILAAKVVAGSLVYSLLCGPLLFSVFRSFRNRTLATA